MRDSFKTTIRVGITLGAITSLVGCAELPGETGAETGAAVQSQNGLSMNGLSMNGLSMNGLSMNGLSMNGLSMNGLSMNGLASTNGLAATNGLMTTSGGRDIVKYLVRCALPSGVNLVKQDQNGVSYTFPGAIGVAPEWNSSATGVCGVDCQEKVSACMLAHVNNAGAHIALWLVSDGAIGWGKSTDYPYQEGSFFGNLFPNPWKGYYCTGKDFYTASVPGRLGAPLTSTVYTNPFGAVECQASGRCVPHGTDGYDSCQTYDNKVWPHVVTVWRNFDINSQYKICNYGTGETKCLGVVGSSTADNARIEGRAFSSSSNFMKWQVTQIAVGKYKIVNVGSGKSLDVDASGNLLQKTYAGTASQQTLVKSLSPYGQNSRYQLLPSSTPAGYDASFVVPSSIDGGLVSTTYNTSMDTAKWTVTPL